MKICGLFLSFLFFSAVSIYAFEETTTHPQLTKRSIEINEGYFNKFLIEEMLLNKGVTSEIGGKTVLSLLRDGSQDEDKPTMRSFNHYHTPVLSDGSSGQMDWFHAGLTDPSKIFCPGTIYSAAVWSTNFGSPSLTGHLPEGFTWNELNWDRARTKYRSAMLSNNTAHFSSSFGDTVRTLGRTLHMIQDMAVPAHTRNDGQGHGHFKSAKGLLDLLSWAYANIINITFQSEETFLEIQNRMGSVVGNPFETYVGREIRDLIDDIPSTVSGSPVNHLPRYWDADTYDGDNLPDGSEGGLAEFSNAYFFSPTSISPGEHDIYHTFPRPNPAELASVPEFRTINGESVSCSYKQANVPGKGACHMYLESIIQRELRDEFARSGIDVSDPGIRTLDQGIIDSVCHQDYAEVLLPKAVAWSSNVLNYFFRGRMKVSVTFEGFDDTTYQPIFKLNVANNTKVLDEYGAETGEFEEMKDGNFVLVQIAREGGAVYYYPAAYPFDGSTFVVPANEPVSTDFENPAQYELENFAATLAGDKEIDDFDFTLVYWGGLGEEKDLDFTYAVAAKRFTVKTGVVITQETSLTTWSDYSGGGALVICRITFPVKGQRPA